MGTRRTIFRTSILAGCLMLVSAAGHARQLVNPSFEQAGEAADRAAGWGRWGQWMNRESGWTPTRTGHCVMAYHHWRIEDGNTSGFYQDVSGARAGAVYSFRVYAHLDPAAAGKEGPQSIEVRLESTVEGRQVTVSSRTYHAEDVARAATWSPLKISGTAPNDTLRVVVLVTPAAKGARDGALSFDDAALTERRNSSAGTALR